MPEFNSEQDEAQWWYDNRAKVEEALLGAMDNGTILRGTAPRLTREARASRNITIRMAEADLDLARKQALPISSYLDRERHKSGMATTRSLR